MTRRNIKPNVISWKHTIISVYCRHLARVRSSPEKVDPNITNDQIPGRSHFDYCVNYIVGKLDDAANVLPATRSTEDLGRATSTICKCLKARVLLYAASPLWNGSFYKADWQE